MQSESTRNANKVMLTINSVIIAIFFFGYIMEYFKGGRTLPYILVFLSILLIPAIVALVIYLKNRASEKVRYIALAGHMILYLFVMLTTDSPTTFTYCFPIILMYYQYFDFALMVVSCSVISLINISVVIDHLFLMRLNGTDATTDYTIQLAAVIMFCFALVVSTKISKRHNKQNQDTIHTEQQKQKLIIDDILKTAAIIGRNSRNVQSIVDALASNAEIISNAVAEISSGVVHTAESIQNQSSMTRNIHSLIIGTSELSDKMNTLSGESIETLNEGIANVHELSEKASLVNEKSLYAYKKMQELTEKAHEIQNITEIITGISEQTNMLSLNATIEAARAGINGRGFAVVADEIRRLSAQSTQSAATIAEILKALETKASRTSDAVMTLKETNDQQTNLILNTKQIFENLAQKMALFIENVHSVNQRIDDIVSSNNKIMDSINEISALSQEATANAEEAGAMTTVSKEKSKQARTFVSELIETSVKMDKYI